MADTKLSALTELAAPPADNDQVYLQDVSEAASAQSKRITIANLLADVADLTGDEIVVLLEALAGAARLSHTKISDVGVDDHHVQSHDLASHSTKAHSELSDAPEGAHHTKFTTTEHSAIGDSAPHHTKYTDSDVIAVAVAKALFDAHSILMAVSDNTPVALPVAASRILGRKSTGNIAALTAAELLTIINVAAGADVTADNVPQSHGIAQHTDVTRELFLPANEGYIYTGTPEQTWD